MLDSSEKASEAAKSHLRSPSRGEVPLASAADGVLEEVGYDLTVTGEELTAAEENAKELSLEEVRAILRNVIQNHENDQNFPVNVLDQMKDYVANEDISAHPEEHQKLIHEMKVEAALISNDSPYPEVRAVSFQLYYIPQETTRG